MSGMLASYFQYPFIRYAFLVGILISLCSSLLGVTLVLKRFSFISDGLSHVAFGVMAVAGVVGLTNQMALVLPVTILCAIVLLRGGGKSRIRGDSAVAMISVGSMAVGYLLMSVFSSSSNLSGDVCSTLFGSASMLTLSKGKVLACVILSVLVLAAFVLFYDKIFCMTFDEPFAKATGLETEAYNLIIAVIIAVIIVMAMNLVGSLLVSALIVFPSLSAMRIFRSFKSVTICSAIISVFCSSLGMIVSILASTPVGATIVAADILVFAVSFALGRVMRCG